MMPMNELMNQRMLWGIELLATIGNENKLSKTGYYHIIKPKSGIITACIENLFDWPVVFERPVCRVAAGCYRAG